ncbi:hypothetical protein SAMN05421839_10576 [Halolactibacillus halophilus]|uniref:Uncharacterized protein n=1 Tax=Halolactibacillus halophilus TaxID=306540 RepID=A0A1I5MG82_9BACI|nr:hypothetical protein [Halolactibacillus halophilus]GEM02195.1 hypothetical protein HHA03_17270 [Halolactibacillus halophilus]SFP08595.1 hypothetical protein SAMN05421839_10576 [Halolactibacillus halophilus]
MFDNIDVHFDSLNNEEQGESIVNVRELVTESYNPYEINVIKVKPKVEMDQSVKTSINLPEFMFSNMIPTLEEKAIDSNVEIGLEKLNRDPSLLLTSSDPIDYKGKNKQRIKGILCEYVGASFFKENCDYFRKSVIVTESLLGSRGAFRVICTYVIKPKTDDRQRHSKHILKAIALDPYHLFLPGAHNNLTPEEMMEKVYSEVCEYSEHIGKMIKI